MSKRLTSKEVEHLYRCPRKDLHPDMLIRDGRTLVVQSGCKK